MPDAIIQRMCSCLHHHRQRVMIGNVMSDWLVINAGMPQGSYLGPLTFIMLVDSLQALCMTHKYVDDTTLSEIVAKSATSHMQIYCDEVVQQSEPARMNINGRKTKEMLIGSISKDPPPHLMLCGVTVDRVTTFKLLGVHVSSNLKWTDHVDAMVSNAASRLHFLKQLNRAGAPIRDLLHFYIAIVRPVLEYACPVWHSGLTDRQSKTIKNIQKCTIHIIYGESDYKTALIVAGVDSLKNRC